MASRIKVVVKSVKDKKDFDIPDTETIKELKEAVAKEFVATVEQLCLIFAGKILNDTDTLRDCGVRDGTTLHLVIKSANRSQEQAAQRAQENFLAAQSQANIGATPFGLGDLGGLAGLSGLGMGSANFMDLQQRMQREMLSNPDMMRNLMDNPFVQQLMSNPEIMRQLMTSNPQLRELMEKNPEILHVMNNPDLMRQTLEVVRNPAMLQELMRSGDGQSTAQSVLTAPFSGQQGQAASAKPPGQPKPEADLGGPFNSAGMQSMLQQMVQNPQLMTNMLQAPYVQSMMQYMGTNPQLVGQMMTSSPALANNPQLQEQVHQNLPYFAEQMQNPEIQSLMSNPRALQAMLQIQQSMQELHTEGLSTNTSVPGLVFPPVVEAEQPATTDEDGSTPAPAQPPNPTSQLMSQMMNLIASSNRPPEERFAMQLNQLHTMGFVNRDANIQVLTTTSGDVNAAVERLLQQA